MNSNTSSSVVASKRFTDVEVQKIREIAKRIETITQIIRPRYPVPLYRRMRSDGAMTVVIWTRQF